MNLPELTVVASGNSGIEIRAKLSEAYNLVEFKLRGDVPQPVFISPWMQFEPAKMNDERLHLAHEIARRAVAHEELLKQVTDLQAQLERSRQHSDTLRRANDEILDRWSKEREKYGLPEDFSDFPITS